MEHPKIIADGITFDDVLLIPAYSDFVPTDADTRTKLTRSIEINIPLLSAPMDTVTEAALAIALAQEGGIGIVHKNLPAIAQAREVEKVKRSENGVIVYPITLPPTATIATARRVMREYNVSGIPIVDGDAALADQPLRAGQQGVKATGHATGGNGSSSARGPRLLGIMTRRDLKFQEDDNRKVGDVMTKENLVTAPEETSLEDAERILYRSKVEKLLLVDKEGRLSGLITMRD
ncbi:MAG TPA: IMP dehydrogenase, partial [Tepidisphaeraceae bacterium]|nr:IMP dehydrogenase [Tepidisphaeraceae bacterium]